MRLQKLHDFQFNDDINAMINYDDDQNSSKNDSESDISRNDDIKQCNIRNIVYC